MYIKWEIIQMICALSIGTANINNIELWRVFPIWILNLSFVCYFFFWCLKEFQSFPLLFFAVFSAEIAKQMRKDQQASNSLWRKKERTEKINAKTIWNENIIRVEQRDRLKKNRQRSVCHSEKPIISCYQFVWTIVFFSIFALVHQFWSGTEQTKKQPTEQRKQKKTNYMTCYYSTFGYIILYKCVLKNCLFWSRYTYISATHIIFWMFFIGDAHRVRGKKRQLG